MAAAVLFLTTSIAPLPFSQPDLTGAAFLFCLTLLYYSLHDGYSKVYQHYSLQRPRAVYWQRHWRRLMVAPGLALLVLPWLAWPWLTVGRLAWLILFGLLAAGYSFPLLPARWRPRRHPLLKLGVLATTWAVLPVVLAPASGWLTAAQVWLVVQRFSLLLIICIPFDWRDAAHDRAAGARTLPDYYSPAQVSRCLVVLALVQMLFMVASTPWLTGYLPMLIACLPTCIALALALLAVRRPVWPIGYLLLDAMLILQPLVVGMLQHLAYIRSFTLHQHSFL
ncbi:MAG: hypothetical protein MUF62_07460 [Chitinophagaceae bacterium]|nr:hypothetical protein [Chitinophagaceae bacterium]